MAAGVVGVTGASGISGAAGGLAASDFTGRDGADAVGVGSMAGALLLVVGGSELLVSAISSAWMSAGLAVANRGGIRGQKIPNRHVCSATDPRVAQPILPMRTMANRFISSSR